MTQDTKKRAGRPKARPGEKYVTTAFSLPEKLAKTLAKAAEEAGMGKSEFLRKLIKEKLGE